MEDVSQLRATIADLSSRSEQLRGYLDYAGKADQLEQVLGELEDPEVWNNPERAQELGRERARLEEIVQGLDTIRQSLEDVAELLDLAVEENEESALEDVRAELAKVESRVGSLEFQRMFSGEADASNAFVDITAGAGGTEAQDWAGMLQRMYLRWCEAHGFSVEIIEESEGEVAGIKSVTLLVKGAYAYGWLRTETGTHRLVRKSPFDSGNRRHTSFASIYVSPEIDDSVEVEINDGDLRIDVYRASGAGGQHVNRTESAVRITHLPTNIVVQCQNDRSQHKNKATAMKQLRAKLYEEEMRKRREAAQIEEAGKSDIGWGTQIRSYVLDQSRIKDLRTNVEIGNTQAVLDGDLDPFLKASLQQGL
ncbi:MAG: peptide chain release factor 2 [Pseudomonadota bacterium]